MDHNYLEKEGKQLAAEGKVNRFSDHFRVSSLSMPGSFYRVSKDASGKVNCDCEDFLKKISLDQGFRCGHIMAVRYAMDMKNTEASVRKPINRAGHDPRQLLLNTEPIWSENGEQKLNGAHAGHIADGRAIKMPASTLRLKTTKGANTMKTRKSPAIESGNDSATEIFEAQSNVMPMTFASKLQTLRKTVGPEMIRHREGWKDSGGNIKMFDYIEWHTVADILDETAPNWSHSVKDIRQIGGIITVTVAITVDGVTREGIGTGLADSEAGIKKAEHDALKRAAVKFGIARDLYKKESESFGFSEIPSDQARFDFPSNPVARSLSDLVTAKQLGMIRALSRELKIDSDIECDRLMLCKSDELSRLAASSFIRHLQDVKEKKTTREKVAA